MNFLRLDGDWCKHGFSSVGQPEYRGYLQVLGRCVVSQLQLATPTGLRGPIGKELLLVSGRRYLPHVGWVRRIWSRLSDGKLRHY